MTGKEIIITTVRWAGVIIVPPITSFIAGVIAIMPFAMFMGTGISKPMSAITSPLMIFVFMATAYNIAPSRKETTLKIFHSIFVLMAMGGLASVLYFEPVESPALYGYLFVYLSLAIVPFPSIRYLVKYQ